MKYPMKFGVALCVAFVFMAMTSEAQDTINDFQGTWTTGIDLPFLLTLTEAGVDNVCRVDLPPECEQEIPQGTETVVVEGNTISISFITLEGVNTTEQAAAMFPNCAAAGIFPFETVTPLPLAEIQSYDPSTGHLTFIDSRRPDDLNCVVLTLNEMQKGEAVPSIHVEYMLSSVGTLDRIVEIGPSFRCTVSNDVCISEFNAERELTAYIHVEFELPCGMGACMGAAASRG